MRSLPLIARHGSPYRLSSPVREFFRGKQRVEGTQAIKGNRLDYYLNLLHETREKTLAELKNLDDKWLAAMDSDAGANNFAKWFHVAEHESNHDGQIKFLKSRLPGAKPASG